MPTKTVYYTHSYRLLILIWFSCLILKSTSLFLHGSMLYCFQWTIFQQYCNCLNYVSLLTVIPRNILINVSVLLIWMEICGNRWIYLFKKHFLLLLILSTVLNHLACMHWVSLAVDYVLVSCWWNLPYCQPSPPSSPISICMAHAIEIRILVWSYVHA